MLRRSALLVASLSVACGPGNQQDGSVATGTQAEAATPTTGSFDVDAGLDRPQTAFGDPLPGLDSAHLSLFNAGKAKFLTVEDAADGLGPVFNDSACANCHSVPATGGGNTSTETRFGKVTNGHFDPLASEGGSLIQVHGIGVVPDPHGGPACNYVGELVPADANVVAKRRTTPLFGLGLVDAVPDATFRTLAQLERRAFPGEAGVVAVVHDIQGNRDAVGRFGWKDQNPTLHQFAGDAYLNEMGVTNPEFPDESCPQGDCSLLRCNPKPGLNDDGTDVTAFTDFMTLLAAPPGGVPARDVERGRAVFRTVGCNHCHTPTMTTGDSAVAALSHKAFHPYSDFLLHDMGSLGDGIVQGPAGGRQMRTAPLWGAHQLTSFLHDGRASSVAEAIQAHDGQGAAARNGFDALPAADKQALLDFVNSL